MFQCDVVFLLLLVFKFIYQTGLLMTKFFKHCDSYSRE